MGLDSFEIRAGTPAHLDTLAELARHLDTVNLPDDRAALTTLLETSERSFARDIADPTHREYVLVLWDRDAERAAGTSSVLGRLGRRGAPYIYFDVRSEEKYSKTLDRHFRHTVLATTYVYDGPTEIGGLVVHPEYRRRPERLGRFVSYARFLLLAMRRADFRDEVVAELLPPLGPDGTSHLWEAVGRRFTGLEYRTADRLSKGNKEFIRGLFPDQIYATLLAPEAQQVIGAVGAATRPVAEMLERVGFRYAHRVDPFDGGPHYLARTDAISIVRRATRKPVRIVADQAEILGTKPAMVAVDGEDPPQFRVITCREAREDRIELTPRQAEALDIVADDFSWTAPLSP